SFVSPLTDYSIPLISNETLSTGIAGLIGVLLTFFVAWGVAKLLILSRQVEITS
ncbi:MAG: PDGLE domain-containing protein, partial [Candidatus Omnitrophica bacterium]|nr:PDGLE domain-containing protein [Candidatus Omnitrophota bacterium]